MVEPILEPQKVDLPIEQDKNEIWEKNFDPSYRLNFNFCVNFFLRENKYGGYFFEDITI